MLFAKDPRDDSSKTRLIGQTFSQQDASEIAEAMLICIANRLRHHFDRLILATATDASPADFAAYLDINFDIITPQGDGSLGQRIFRVWKGHCPDSPAAVFGMDSPDIPTEYLGAIHQALANHDVAIGSTMDGGYWTLAANRFDPTLFEDIDWGSDTVYDATRRQILNANLTHRPLPHWQDVDEPADLTALHQRLQLLTSQQLATDPPLADLRNFLAAKLHNHGP